MQIDSYIGRNWKKINYLIDNVEINYLNTFYLKFNREIGK